jgi:hypothetical protein
LPVPVDSSRFISSGSGEQTVSPTL